MNSLRLRRERLGWTANRVRTYDMGGKDSTLDVAKAIAEYASS